MSNFEKLGASGRSKIRGSPGGVCPIVAVFLGDRKGEKLAGCYILPNDR
ncbi:MAG: hypothetical protein JGK31_01660 [Microcoleus sp. PH2017_30_WIL_O_A]|nr:hypothetical protein [Microcoleus sp. PH2017_13_LAR_U_A]MCC3511182.1 hypothetical protein [Microcoleus sp. PH2017_17_BER_D_A]MCC3582835.1 hypothetical protein [Microcoleus sp. PH2017_30_WIL_O_A]